MPIPAPVPLSIPRIDLTALFAGDPAQAAEVRRGATEVGFLTVHNAPLGADRVLESIAAYRAFFQLPGAEKARVDMSKTGSNRGWGAPGSEQVDPNANPDYKQVFDIGFEVPGSTLSVHAPNLWPIAPEGFSATLQAYYDDALALSRRLLSAIAAAIGQDPAWFDDKFDQPMALLRGNYYPPRPEWATEKDFGIAAHTDYGCLTLLATDGVPGLEVLGVDKQWYPVQANPGEFIINFGEMLELWSDGLIKATLHRVVGGVDERISVPLFFNPSPDVNVAPVGSGKILRAVDHLERRFNETYVHLKQAQAAG